ncbi:hypothetical protein [Niveispirillum sp. KHB5.9]|uniref:hypothetical protein n=1 Tax=Niveispirillum sp. KHB5.9 TaxID=3400269 RepID=UPI003A8A7F6F
MKTASEMITASLAALADFDTERQAAVAEADIRQHLLRSGALDALEPSAARDMGARAIVGEALALAIAGHAMALARHALNSAAAAHHMHDRLAALVIACARHRPALPGLLGSVAAGAIQAHPADMTKGNNP